MSQRMPSSRRKTAILKNHDYFDSSEDEEDGEEEYHNIKGGANCARGHSVECVTQPSTLASVFAPGESTSVRPA